MQAGRLLLPRLLLQQQQAAAAGGAGAAAVATAAAAAGVQQQGLPCHLAQQQQQQQQHQPQLQQQQLRGLSQYFDAPNGPAVTSTPIEEEWYNRQRNLMPLMDKTPWIQPDTWVAPNAVVLGDVDIYDKASGSAPPARSCAACRGAGVVVRRAASCTHMHARTHARTQARNACTPCPANRWAFSSAR